MYFRALNDLSLVAVVTGNVHVRW